MTLAFFHGAVAEVYPDRIEVYWSNPFPGTGWIITQLGDRLICKQG